MLQEKEPSWLDVSGLNISSSFLKKLPSGLRGLNLSETPIVNKDLKHLSGLQQLNHLNLSRTQVSGGLQALTPLPLNDLSLAGCHKSTTTGLKPLGALTELRTLDLSGCGVTPKTAKILKSLVNLEDLDVSWDERAICQNGCQGRFGLIMHSNGIEVAGMKVLRELSRLRRLAMRGHYITQGMAKLFKSFPSLERLELDGCVSEEGLKLESGVRELSLRGCGRPLVDSVLKSLGGFPALTSLNLRESIVHDPMRLQNATSLRELLLPDGTQADALRESLPECRIASRSRLGYLALRFDEEARSHKVYADWHNLIASYIIHDPVAVLPVYRRPVRLTLQNFQRLRSRHLFLDPEQLYPDEEQARANAMPVAAADFVTQASS